MNFDDLLEKWLRIHCDVDNDISRSKDGLWQYIDVSFYKDEYSKFDDFVKNHSSSTAREEK